MRLNFSHIRYIAIALTMISCNDDLTFNQTDKDNQIVVHAMAEVGKNLRVNFKQSERITEDTLNNPIGGVAVELYVNEAPTESTYSDGLGNAIFNYNVQSGDSLRLEMNKPSFSPVTTQTIVPNSIGILQFDTTNKRASVQGLRVSFYDQPQEENYYQISLKGARWYYQLDPNTGLRTDSILSFEDIQMTSVNRLFFSDNNIVNNRQNFELLNDMIFNGKNFVLDIDVSRFQLAEQYDRSAVKSLHMELKNIGQDYYNFLATLSLNRPVYGGPFSISSQVPTNISGGYGIFAAYSTDVATITIE